jgi:pyrroline-5-carboxylate reductase
MNANEGKIGFIGAGNMATAMVKGLTRSGLYTPDQLLASDPDESKIRAISETFGLKGSANNQALVSDCAIIVLAIKPQVIREVLEEIKEDVRDDHLVISIAAGIPIKLIQAFIGPGIPVIRVMPNTPALIQKGISALAPGKAATPDHVDTAKVIFDAVGETVIVQEEMMDAVTALSGSGPGFLYRIMECFVEAGVLLGFDTEISRRLVIQTFLGATQLAGESGKTLSELREMVTSPGGTTEAGLAVFAGKDLEGLIQEVLEAAHQRGVELGEKK